MTASLGIGGVGTRQWRQPVLDLVLARHARNGSGWVEAGNPRRSGTRGHFADRGSGGAVEDTAGRLIVGPVLVGLLVLLRAAPGLARQLDASSACKIC